MNPPFPVRLATLAFVSLLGAACGTSEAPAPAAAQKAPAERASAASAAHAETPDFRGEDLRGNPFALADQRGDVGLLNVWASWCEPCKEELPTLADLYRERGGEGLRVVGVSVDAVRTQDEVRRIVRDLRIPYPIVLDPRNTIAPMMKIVGYPTTFIIGRDGQVRWRRDGLIERDDPEVARELQAALEAPKPS